MAEIRRGYGEEGQGGQRLPWLEPVEDEEDYYPEPAGRPWLKWVLILIALAGVAVVLTSIVGRWNAQRSDIGTLIKADPTPYKVRPADPGGLKVDNNDRIAQRTGVGSDINSPLDLAAIPEEPIIGAGAPQRAPASVPATSAPAPRAASPAAGSATPAPAPRAEPARPAPTPSLPEPVAAPSSSGGSAVQLGAFSTEPKAKAAWKTLSKRFAYLAPLTPVILPVKSGETTLYRLRASGGPAGSICARLKVAGEACAVAN
ncbi:SPOR domain-containing protein [Sphingomonas sp.]|uniref:SPOR domain-containing protein n=1 Tax=Sphingomonas sp. TaxID=28214 RepID=UPI003B3BD28D